jgi:hypothetical protein
MQKSERKVLLNDDLKDKEWIGRVVENDDPELLGRCRVRVFGVFDTLPDEHLPWAFPATNCTFAGGDGGSGFLSVPKIGTLLKIKFANSDRYSPEYYGIVNISQDVQDAISGSYVGSHVLVFDVDENLKIFYTPSIGMKITMQESNITINADKSITIEHADSKSIIELNGSNIAIVSQEQVKVTSPKTVIDSPVIELGEGAAEALIKGDTFKAFFDAHTHPGPNTPPTVPIPSGVLSKTSKTK